ncbi:MAG: LysR family transcriptional regulator [Exilibacterium sp.]
MSICDIGIPDLSLRHLKAALYVARDKSVTRAANKLNRSQTAITKAINDLEAQLGVPLFDRSATGMLPTAHGAAMVTRVALAEAEFAAAEKAYRNFIQKPPGNNPVFSLEISYKRLAAFIALYESGDINVAAGMLGVTRAAVYNSTRQLEDLLEITLFEREPNGFAPTSYSNVLARHIKLAFSQIRHGLDDLANLSGITRGSVAIGTLPYTRTILTPRAIILLLNDHPQLDVSTREGPYSILEASLRNGDLDFIIGALRTAHSPPDLRTEILFHDRLSIIARKGHPLANCRGLSLHQLTDHQWVLPGRNTPSRQLFDEILCHHGLAAPQHCVETSSLSTLRGLLLESDRIALLSEHQIYYDNQYGLLTALPIELKDSYRPIGVTMRAHTTPSPAAALFLNHLRNVAAEPDSPASKIENGYRSLSPLPG